MAKKMDAFSAALMADKREIIFAPTVYKFETFAQLAVGAHRRNTVWSGEQNAPRGISL